MSARQRNGGAAGAVARTDAPAPPPAPFLSEGLRQEVEQNGWAIDPGSGAKFVKDKETGEITVVAKKDK